MRMMRLTVLGCFCLVSGLVTAAPVEVGTGVSTAGVTIEWSDGFSAEFRVHFGDDVNDTITGLELMTLIEAGTELTTVRQDFGWGEFVDGFSYQGHSEAGFGGGDLWWHYWENNAGSRHPWQSSMTGAGGRIVAHGDTDAWIYGHGNEPPAIDISEVGSGVNHADVFIEWADGFTAEFRVRFGIEEADTTTGQDLMNIIEAETELTTVRSDFGWGEFIDGIEFLRHGNTGFAGGEFWWHYWENDAGSRSPWRSSLIGAGARVVSHGDTDAWVYGHALVPVPASEHPFLAGYGQYAYDANDFASTVVAYEPQGMYRDWLTDTAFDDPHAALGRPTVDTTGDDWTIPMDQPSPVVPVYSPMRSHELVWLGEGGSITLSFNHPVRDDLNNPFGIDFIVFGNPWQLLGGSTGWSNGDPRDVIVGALGESEPGIVSVSQDGETWYSFTNDSNALGGDPTNAQTARAFDVEYVGTSAPPYLLVGYDRKTNAIDVEVAVETTPALGVSWSTNNIVQVFEIIPGSHGSDRIRARVPASVEMGFVRLKVTR